MTDDEVIRHENHCSPDRCRYGQVDCPVRVGAELSEVTAEDLSRAVGRPVAEAQLWLTGMFLAAVERLSRPER